MDLGRREDARVDSRFHSARLKADDCLSDVAVYIDNNSYNKSQQNALFIKFI
jgi:hypothetical protein